jgi:hypothetical protein
LVRKACQRPSDNSAWRTPVNPTLRENSMKMLAVVVLVLTSLAGCVAYPAPYDSGPPGGHHGGYQNRGDRDGDGVRNRHDRRPNNPNRY